MLHLLVGWYRLRCRSCRFYNFHTNVFAVRRGTGAAFRFALSTLIDIPAHTGTVLLSSFPKSRAVDTLWMAQSAFSVAGVFVFEQVTTSRTVCNAGLRICYLHCRRLHCCTAGEALALIRCTSNRDSFARITRGWPASCARAFTLCMAGLASLLWVDILVSGSTWIHTWCDIIRLTADVAAAYTVRGSRSSATSDARGIARGAYLKKIDSRSFMHVHTYTERIGLLLVVVYTHISVDKQTKTKQTYRFSAELSESKSSPLIKVLCHDRINLETHLKEEAVAFNLQVLTNMLILSISTCRFAS